jgi:hypothetical protein
MKRILRDTRAPYVLALLVQALFYGYVKDDAFIEYRYAQHVGHGQGLTFNVGQRVEGFTSFLWTLFLGLPARLGLNLVVVAKLVGAAAVLALIAVAGRFLRARGEDERVAQLCRWLVATNASIVVWGACGMEPAECALAVLGGAYLLQQRRELGAMLLFSVAALIRPECHLVWILATALVLRRRKLVAVVLALVPLVAAHYFRWRYFHALVPNTALVKAATFDWWSGTRAVAELGVTSLALVPIVLTVRAAWQRRDDVAVFIALSVLAFVAYLFRIGHDEMFLSRLYLPVWPLTLVLAAAPLSRARPAVPAFIAIVGIGFIVGCRIGTLDNLRRTTPPHVALAELMQRHARPGDLVIFQDLGQAPYAAMELDFIDPIGLVDPLIARLRHDDHASPFQHQPRPPVRAQIRDHLFALDAKLVAYVAYIPKQLKHDVRERFLRATTPADREQLLSPFLYLNTYYVGLHEDERFAQRYRFVDVVYRRDDYWFVLFERR